MAFAANSGGQELIFFLLIAALVVGGLFKLWMIVARPEVYKAQLENERHRREQRNGLLGPALGSGFKLLGMFLGRRK